MLKRLRDMFIDANTRWNRKLETFPIPMEYLDRIFKFDHPDYKDFIQAEYFLGEALNTKFFFKHHRQNGLYQPPMDEFVAKQRRPREGDPSNVMATGGILVTSYLDIFGRKGLAVGLVAPNPFQKGDVQANIVFAINWYLDEKTQQFYVHDLYHANFSWFNSRPDGLSHEVFMSQRQVAISFIFAEKITREMFEGRGDQVHYNLNAIWKTSNNAVNHDNPRPWAAPDPK